MDSTSALTPVAAAARSVSRAATSSAAAANRSFSAARSSSATGSASSVGQPDRAVRADDRPERHAGDHRGAGEHRRAGGRVLVTSGWVVDIGTSRGAARDDGRLDAASATRADGGAGGSTTGRWTLAGRSVTRVTTDP